MCGILVVVGPAATQNLSLNSLQHRGPDACGHTLLNKETVYLGHTRLSILDVSSAGAQPMTDEESGNVICFNGEIYNHEQLRAQMGPVSWKGHSDTETLLIGYRLWGLEKLLQQARGMFAFAIWDQTASKLVITRDRLGIKPLYYTSLYCGSHVFCSETRPLYQFSPPSVAPDCLSSYLKLGCTNGSSSLTSAITSFPTGHHAEVLASQKLTPTPYWPPSFPATATPSTSSSEKSPPKNLRSHLERAVQEHLISDVPVASFLSAGVDSSVITAMAGRHLGKALQTFSVGFKDDPIDESAQAAAFAKQIGLSNERVILDEPSVIQAVTEAVSLLDLPSVDALNTYIVCREARKAGLKVALSGLGGDELFGGYPSFRDAPKMARLARLPQTLRQLLGLFSEKLARLADLPTGADLSTCAEHRRYFFSNNDLRAAGLPLPDRLVPPPPPGLDSFGQISWTELTGYMRHMLLRDSDQMSMAVSLELRVPLLDHLLVEYVLSLPASAKQGPGHAKWLLVEACRDLLPDSLLNRPKQGFLLPMDTWMRGPLENFVNEGLSELAPRKLLPASFIETQRAAFLSGQRHWTRLWSLVVLGHYCRRHALVASHPNR